MASTPVPSPDWTRPISFRAWSQARAEAPLSAAVREDCRRGLLGLLTVCKQRRAPVTVALIRDHLATPAGAGAREALRWELGEIRFRRAAPRVRMPVVLSRAECERLFAALDRVPRLMAELMYDAGLRLLELLRLRSSVGTG